jgi:hypothetical protein
MFKFVVTALALAALSTQAANAEPITYTCDVGSFTWQEQNGRYTLSIDGGKPINVSSNPNCAKSGFRGKGISVCFATQGYADLTIKGQKTRECNLFIPPQACDGILAREDDEYHLSSSTGGDYCEVMLDGSVDEDATEVDPGFWTSGLGGADAVPF